MQLRATRLTCISNAVRRVVAPPAFTPLFFFSNNEQGIWLDPSDMSTMFQDVTGTTPVTAVEQPVGLILDKSRGLVLGPELVVNGGFATDTAGWTLAAGGAATVSGGVLTLSNVSSRARLSQFSTTVAGRSYQVTVSGVNLGNSTATSARVQLGSSQFILAAGTNSLLYVASGSSTEVVLFENDTTAGLNFSVDNISVREIAGNHATQATATSRPILRQDASGRYYLFFDGIDDSLVTGIITPGTDKVQVFAGVRKLSDVASIVAEFSASAGTSPGAFYLVAGEDASSRYSFLSRGSVGGSGVIGKVNVGFAPDTAVLSAFGDISGDLAQIRRNGVIGASGTADQGSGNYESRQLFIGRRNQSSLPFSGHIYQLTARFGPNLTADQITQAETFFNSKTGAY